MDSENFYESEQFIMKVDDFNITNDILLLNPKNNQNSGRNSEQASVQKII